MYGQMLLYFYILICVSRCIRSGKPEGHELVGSVLWNNTSVPFPAASRIGNRKC